MIVLGIDTATPVTGVAVGDGDAVLASVTARHERAHAELLAPAVRWVLERAGVAPGDLGGIAVGLGPGLFTGLRVGVSTAKSLAQAWGLPLAGVPSLDVLAHPMRFAGTLVCAAIDARRGELFTALYRGGERLGDHRVVAPERLVEELAARGEPVLACGDGARRHAPTLAALGDRLTLAGPAEESPSPAALLELARPLLRDGAGDPLAVTPLYLRRPDVGPVPTSAVRG